MKKHAQRIALRAALVAMLTTLAQTSHAAADAPAITPTIVVHLDRAKVVKVPEKAQTLIVGNPIIADVTLLRGGGTMVITGKGFGETNLVALDSSGNPVGESIIRVQAETGSLLVVQRGAERESYSCTPRCQPTVQLGDAKTFSTDAAGEITARNGLSLPQAPAAASR